jgi:hypothetical protein
MKTISYAVAAAGVASAAAGGSKYSEWTKKELEESTRAFVRENRANIKFTRDKNLRKLISSRPVSWISSGAGKSGKGSLGGSGWGKWSGSNDWSDDSTSESGWSGSEDWSGKSGKGDKSVRAWRSGIHQEAFYILPSSCPGQCISSDVNGDYEFENVVKTCKDDSSQKWNVLSDGSYIMVESYDNPHWCIAIDYKDGDDDKTFEESCSGDYFLHLKECGSYGTAWYFTGGQLISTMCWAGGLSSFMAVFVDRKDEECGEGLTVAGETIVDAIMRADTFMFVSHLPKSPLKVDDKDDDKMDDDKKDDDKKDDDDY